MEVFPARFASEKPFYSAHYPYDEEMRTYRRRVLAVYLKCDPEHLFAELDTPNGIQLCCYHEYNRQSVGRVLTMEFKRKELVGTVGVEDVDLRSVVAGGIPSLKAGIQRGLSIGADFIESPPYELEMRKGNRARPDKLTYGALKIREVTLTSVPRIYNAGILGDIQMDTTATDTAAGGDTQAQE